ncbi:BINDING PROTEIN putative-RELATED [Salix viminalis]|uniref:BINDING PROTEIN putative-RELATED n=1 Tax=Salix viminalis TaxID=40686 RepID=A0A9Q0T7Q7_SALVM|nr:BINDING PROTEIN putative-RELATED [Salix viminalis]
MAKVHALPQVDSSSSSSYISSKPETFTIWMKSLVMQTNGCTVYNENGDVVYRVDNYDKKGSDEVYLMDLRGNVLFTILTRKLFLSRRWRGYKSDGFLKLRNQKPYFQVQNTEIFQGNLSCRITVRSREAPESCHYKLEALAGKLAFKITSSNGEIVAEVRILLILPEI